MKLWTFVQCFWTADNDGCRQNEVELVETVPILARPNECRVHRFSPQSALDAPSIPPFCLRTDISAAHRDRLPKPQLHGQAIFWEIRSRHLTFLGGPRKSKFEGQPEPNVRVPAKKLSDWKAFFGKKLFQSLKSWRKS